MAKKKLIRNILLLAAGVIAYILVELVFSKNYTGAEIIHRLIVSYIIFMVVVTCNTGLRVIYEARSHKGIQHNIPLLGLIQAVQIVLYFIGGIIIIAVLINKSPSVLLTGLGASAAVLMLVFKDSILGLVAGVQLSQNNMIRLGDWIQMPDGSANGTVEEITLNTVKVRNWDNTLSMIPPYTLVSSTFKNWRGMQESGGRRVDKMIYIDVNSLKIRPEDNGVTNIQRYREYIESYLKTHPYVNADLDLIITQKEATPYGLPVEVYFFTKEKSWAAYEKQQSEIFDHLMTVVSDFGLQLYQRP
jgi:small-conductance mechanosensitive channel